MELQRSKRATLSFTLADSMGALLEGLDVDGLAVMMRKSTGKAYAKTLVSGENFREVEGLKGVYEIDIASIDTIETGILSVYITEGVSASGVMPQTHHYSVVGSIVHYPTITQSYGYSKEWKVPLTKRRGDSLSPTYPIGTTRIVVESPLTAFEVLPRIVGDSYNPYTYSYNPYTWETPSSLAWFTTQKGDGEVYGINLDEDLTPGNYLMRVTCNNEVPTLDVFEEAGYGGQLHDIFFEDEYVGWAIIQSPPTVLHTTDGGAFWVPVDDPGLSSMSTPNALSGAFDGVANCFHIFVAGEGADAYFWNGSTWTTLTTHATATGECLGIHARTSTDVWFVGALTSGLYGRGRFISRWNGSVMSSAGTPPFLGSQDEGSPDALFSVHSPLSGHAYVAGISRLARTTNGGASWTTIFRGVGNVGQFSVTAGFIAGAAGYIFTSNGGSSWSTEVSLSDKIRKRRIVSSGDSNAFLVEDNAVWHIANYNASYTLLSEYGGNCVSYHGDSGILRVAGPGVFSTTTTGGVPAAHITVNITEGVSPRIDSVYADTRDIHTNMMAKKPLSGVAIEGAPYTMTVYLNDSTGPVLGAGITHTYYLNGIPTVGDMTWSEIEKGYYSLGFDPAVITEGDLVVDLRPDEPEVGADYNWNYVPFPSDLHPSWDISHITTLDDGVSKYGLVVGTIQVGEYTYEPVAYYTTDFITWAKETSLGGDYSAIRSAKVGTDIIVAVVSVDYDMLYVQVNLGPWVSYPLDGLYVQSINIETLTKIWLITEGSICLWDGTSITEVHNTPYSFYDSIMIGTSLWIVGDGLLCEYDTVADSFSNETSRLGVGEEPYLTFIRKGREGRVLLGGGDVWLSEDNMATLDLQVIDPSSYTDIYGDDISIMVTELTCTGGFAGDNTPLLACEVYFGFNSYYFTAHYDGVDWLTSTYDPAILPSYPRILSEHGFSALLYYDEEEDTAVVATAQWLNGEGTSSPQFSPQTLRVAVLSNSGGEGADLGPVIDSLNEIKGVGFTSGNHSLVSVKDAVDAIDTGTVDLGPVLDALSAIMGEDFEDADSLVSSSAKLEHLTGVMARNLGLSQENLRISGQQYDANGNLIGSIIKIYPTGVDVVADTNPIAEYSLTVAYDVNNRLIDYQFVRT